jgi:hypothetical protein
MMAKSTISGGWGVDTTDLRLFAKKMAEADPNLTKQFAVALKESALPVVRDAQALASWSSRIPGSIRAGGGLTKIVIRAGSANAPHAAAYEHHGQPGTFRHPVFGNRNNWVTQTARPFLVPAAEKNAPNTGHRAEDAVRIVLSEAGFH